MSFKSCTCISLKTKKMQTLLDGSNFNKTDPANVQGWAHRRGSPVIRLCYFGSGCVFLPVNLKLLY